MEDHYLGRHDGILCETSRLCLEGKGTVRTVINDHKEPGRLYAAIL